MRKIFRPKDILSTDSNTEEIMTEKEGNYLITLYVEAL